MHLHVFVGDMNQSSPEPASLARNSCQDTRFELESILATLATEVRSYRRNDVYSLLEMLRIVILQYIERCKQ